MAQFTEVRRRSRSDGHQDARIYASLDELVRLQFQASGYSFLPRQPIHSLLSGRHASRLRGRGLNFEELRRYFPGDDIRTIDWKVTARTDSPHVRVYTEERDRPVWLLIDQRQSMFFGSEHNMKSVVAAQTAAIAAWRVLKAGDRVGALIFDDRHIVTITPHRSQERVIRILAETVSCNHALRADAALAPNPQIINDALHRVARLARHDCLIVLISDAFGIDDRGRRDITRTTEHNDVLAAFVFDPLERALADAGRLPFSDGNRQADVDTTRQATRQSFEQDFDRRIINMQRLSRRHAIPLLMLDTVQPLLEQVRAQLGHPPSPRRV